MSTWLRRAIDNRILLWLAFVIVHFHLGYENLLSPSSPMGDVIYTYKYWMDQALGSQYWVGIDAPWVYPIVAILPMLAAYAFGAVFYGSTWLSLIMILNAVALFLLTRKTRPGSDLVAGWWWVLFLCLLGPIALGRIDAVSVAVAMVGVILLAAHPTAAGVLITLATWIKVWPAALLVAIVIAGKNRAAVIGSAIGTSVGVAAIALAFGSGTNVLSFITQQTGRGIEAESPVATIWLWRTVAGAPSTFVYYHEEIQAFEMTGAGVDLAAAIMTPLLAIASLAVAVLGFRAIRRGVSTAELLPLLSLGFIVAFIVFNKVGSPQYIAWLAVPIALAIVTGGAVRRRFHTPAALTLLIAVLTQFIYPYFFDEVVAAQPAMVFVVTVRNLLLIALFTWTIARLVVVPAVVVGTTRFDAEEWTESAWPLGSRDSGEPLEPFPR